MTTALATENSPADLLRLRRAYAHCGRVARREAKNFYYAFVALPRAKRNAICAIYAFMRRADDLADEEALPVEERRRQLQTWRANWLRVCAGGPTNDPVFLAVHDAIKRFDIPLRWLEELIDGVTMDLEPANADGPDTYATFDDLYRYCYLVASVVGLVCIRIFGYTDPRAERLAEETGIAFQLTNILRDVSEDAERNRIYLPLEYLAEHDVPPESLLHRNLHEPPTVSERALLESIADKATRYYQSADQLLPLIHAESRPALWVLVTIYHALLKRIQSANYDVFSSRISVPMTDKLRILATGLMRTMLTRFMISRS